MYAYVYPYKHKNMCLGCTGRGPTHWYRFGGPRTFENYEKLEVSSNRPLSLYLYPMPLGHGDEAISWAQAAALVRHVSVVGSGVVAEPTSDSHMISKKYVDDLIKRVTLVTATPVMTSNETIINGLFYIASASDPPLGIEFSHEPWTAFQNVSTYPNSWTFEVPEDSWIQFNISCLCL